MQVGAKVAEFVGLILFLGAGVFARWILHPPVSAPLRRRIRLGAYAGAVLLLGGSAADVADTIARAAGSFDPSLVMPYLTDTRQGHAILARGILAVSLIWMAPVCQRGTGVKHGAFLVLSLALLATVSLVGHAGALPGVLPFSADLLHLTGVAAWGGALVYGAWLLPWRAPLARDAAVADAARRLSSLGLGSALLITATGVYASLTHLWGPQALTATLYGRVLLVKLAVVCGIAAVAATNRWVLLPSLADGDTAYRLGRLVKIESLLALIVLGITAVLVTQSPADTAPTLSRPVSFRQVAGDWTFRGTIEREDPGRFTIAVEVRNLGGAPPPRAASSLTLTMLDMAMPPVHALLNEVRPGEYRGAFALPMTGRWQMAISAGPASAQFPIQTEDAVFIQRMGPWRVLLPSTTIALAGLGLIVAGLRRLGIGAHGAWPMMAAGAVLAVLGVAAAVRAAG